MREANSELVPEQEVLVRELKRVQLFDKSYLYSSFNPNDIERVRLEGTYRFPPLNGDPDPNLVFCCRVEETTPGVYSISDTNNQDFIFHLVERETYADSKFGAIAVYNREYFGKVDHPCCWFGDPENKRAALVSVVRVEDLIL